MKKNAIKIIFLVILNLCISLQVFGQTATCKALFKNQNEAYSKTLGVENKSGNSELLISYLKILFDEKIVTQKELIQMRDSLEKGDVSNPVPHEINQMGVYFTKSVYQIHYEAVQEIMDRGVENNALINWLHKLIKGDDENGKNRRSTQNLTFEIHQKIEFHRVEPGAFLMGYDNPKIPVKLTQPFEMMSTPVTQLQYVQIQLLLGEKAPEKINPSFNKNGFNSKEIDVDGLKVQMNPNHPVEQVVWEDVQELIKGLNELSKSYDEITQKRLREIIPDHKRGDQYDLPTEAQWEFVMRNRGRHKAKYFDKNDDSEVQKYGWFKENSGEQTQAVATLLPRVVDGMEFYDLEGNVKEMVKDWYIHIDYVEGGKDPIGPEKGMYRVLKGSSFYGSSVDFSSTRSQHYVLPSFKYVGFRLLRVIAK